MSTRTLPCLLLAAMACTGQSDISSTDQSLCNCDGPVPPCCCISPIILDVAGDGITLTSWSDGVMVAMRPGLGPSPRAWTQPGSDDAWLVLDRNGDGKINDGSEMFGNVTPQPPPPNGQLKNGFLALAGYDNGDTLIDKSDDIFLHLRLWQDKSHDGISQPDELHTLPGLGVAAISLAYVDDDLVDEHGNAFRYRANVVAAEGSAVGMSAWDVWLTGVQPKSKTPTASAMFALRPIEGTWWCQCQAESEPIQPGRTCNATDGRGTGSTENAACYSCCTNAWSSLPSYCSGTSCDCYNCVENAELDC